MICQVGFYTLRFGSFALARPGPGGVRAQPCRDGWMVTDLWQIFSGTFLANDPLTFRKTSLVQTKTKRRMLYD
jgi:hypothetical protein